MAIRVLKRIMAPESELRELWEASDDFIEWEATMVALQAAMIR